MPVEPQYHALYVLGFIFIAVGITNAIWPMLLIGTTLIVVGLVIKKKY